jgi:hypothetical protein
MDDIAGEMCISKTIYKYFHNKELLSKMHRYKKFTE